MELTRAGHAFLGSAREALRNVETAVRAAQTGVGDGIERLSLGGMIGSVHPVVGQRVADFRAANPSATVTMISANERALGTSPIEGTLDAAVAYKECVPPGLHRQPLFKEPLDGLVATGHPFAAFDTIAPSQLGTVPLILPDRRSHPLIYARFRAPHHARGRARLRHRR
ncbi:MAG: LysR substrate-binding domain-containing protein [Pseudomonadota bacterium]